MDEDRDALMSYSELDNLHSEMAELFDDLCDVAITPIIDAKIDRDIEEIFSRQTM